MNEECDSHELNLYIQDKLISLIPETSRANIIKNDALSLMSEEKKENKG